MGVIRKAMNWYSRFSYSPLRGMEKPPFQHIIQIGDPRLRKTSIPVAIDKINSDEVQKVITKLITVLKKYNCLGLAAPQIGINMRIFAIQHLAKDISSLPQEYVKCRGMTSIPLTVFINPKLKVVDYQKVVFSEGCQSVQGYMADVPRYRAVKVLGHNEKGEQITKLYKDWAARIAQHEMEHLDGKLYIDIMERKTMHCTCWEEVNKSRGKLSIPFHP